MAIAEQELIEPATTLPRDARPSELVRGWPEDRWCQGAPNDFKGHFCAIGILAEEADFDWSEWRHSDQLTFPVAQFVRKQYGIPEYMGCRVAQVNDFRGKDAAADYLEVAGF